MSARSFWVVMAGALIAVAPASHAQVIVKAEYVTGGTLDLEWEPGYGLPNVIEGETLGSEHPAYDNPSGDHTVGVLTSSGQQMGGIALSATDNEGLSTYEWEANIFLGDGETRRGLVVNADPATMFGASYQFVIEPGLLQLLFRRNEGEGTVETLGEWLTTDTPGGFPATNTWHHMKIVADGPSFRVFWDGTELTDEPIMDDVLAPAWVGVYNFRFDLGNVPVYFDDMVLSDLAATPTETVSWSRLKESFAN